MSNPDTGDKPQIIRAVRRRKAGDPALPPEWRAILEASQEIERDYRIEREKNQKLARELTRMQFEKDILTGQVEQKEHEFSLLERKLNEKLAKEIQGLASAVEQAATANEKAIQAGDRATRAERKAAEAALMAEQRVAQAERRIIEIEKLNAFKIAQIEESAAARIAAAETRAEKQPARVEVADPQLTQKMDELLASIEAQRDEAAQRQSEEALTEATESTRPVVEAATKELAQERVRFRQIASALHREVEYLKQIYPIRGLLAAKEFEVERVKKALKRISINHPDRRVIEQIVQDHINERKNIEQMLQEMEQRLETQCQAIQDAIAESAPEDSDEGETITETQVVSAFVSDDGEDVVLQSQTRPRTSRLTS